MSALIREHGFIVIFDYLPYKQKVPTGINSLSLFFCMILIIIMDKCYLTNFDNDVLNTDVVLILLEFIF